MNIVKKNDKPKAIFLMGPTASGKTSLAIELHKSLPIEIISVDSAMIYRGMDIGTAKPNENELREVPHYIINILDPTQAYSAANFRHDALIEMDKIVSMNRIPLLVGGTMFYHKVLLEGLSPLPPANQKIRISIRQQALNLGCFSLYKKLKKIDPVIAELIHPNDLQRVSRALEIFYITGKTVTELTQRSEKSLPYLVYKFAIVPTNRNSLYERIEKRFYHMLASGFEKEVRALYARGDLEINMPSIRCVGYRQMWSWFENKISYDEMIYQSICNTKQIAKRQLTWLRSWKEVYLLDSDKPQRALNKIQEIISI